MCGEVTVTSLPSASRGPCPDRVRFCPVRRHVEREKLEREKQLRLESERQKTELEQRLLQYQDEIRLAQEALVSAEQ